jgi:hypothetical protein
MKMTVRLLGCTWHMMKFTNRDSLAAHYAEMFWILKTNCPVAHSCAVGLITKLNSDMTSCTCLFKVRYIRTDRSVSRVQWTGLPRPPRYGVLGCCLNILPLDLSQKTDTCTRRRRQYCVSSHFCMYSEIIVYKTTTRSSLSYFFLGKCIKFSDGCSASNYCRV